MAAADPLPFPAVTGLALPAMVANTAPVREPEFEPVWTGTMERAGLAPPLSSAQGHSTLHRDVRATIGGRS